MTGFEQWTSEFLESTALQDPLNIYFFRLNLPPKTKREIFYQLKPFKFSSFHCSGSILKFSVPVELNSTPIDIGIGCSLRFNMKAPPLAISVATAATATAVARAADAHL